MSAARAEAPTLTHRPTISQTQLDNGLQLVWEEDHRQPLVALDARIKGGLRGEGRYLGTGITHAIEHMLFKGTPTRPAGSIDQEVRRYGGTINAFTSLDTTGVTLFVESGHLAQALELLADILQHAVFDQDEFEKERAVIISEIQMNQDDPDRRLQQLFFSRHFLEHPYRHPILGYQPLLERLTVEDLRAFYHAEYQPQNVTLACVGDMDGAAFAKTAAGIFGRWPRGTPDPTHTFVPAEPPVASAKEATAELPVTTAYVTLGFPSVRLSDPDLYPLDVLAHVLGGGESARLYETLVRQQHLAYAVAAWNYTPYDPGVFGIQLRTDPEKIAAATEAALGIVDAIKRSGVLESELQKAKRAVIADHLFGLQTIDAKAADLSGSVITTGDPLFSGRYVEAIGTITAEQVQAAAQRFCDRAKMTTAIVRPAGAAAVAVTPAPARVTVRKTGLKNGTMLLLGTDRTLPIAAIVVAFRGGVRVETDQTQGLSNLVAQLLTKGTAQKNAFQIAEEVEELGGSLEPFSGRDGFGLILQLLAQDVPQGLALMHELVSASAFPDDALATQRELIANQLKAQDDEIFDVGGRLLRRTLFGTHPYRFNPLGDRAVLPMLTRVQCLEFAKRWVVPSNMVVAVFGDVDDAAVAAQVERTFGGLPATASAWPSRLPAAAAGGVRAVTERMAKEQALIMLGFLGSTNTAPDRYALDILTTVLSGMSGRLFQRVRESHGLSYTLGAVHAPGWDPGYVLVYAATRPEEEAKVLQALDEQLELLVSKGVTQEEVDQATRYLIGQHRLDLQHIVGLTKRSALDELYGLGYDAWTTYEAKINGVTVPLVNEAAKHYLTLQRRAQVIISPNGHH